MNMAKNGALVLDAEALYVELRAAVQPLVLAPGQRRRHATARPAKGDARALASPLEPHHLLHGALARLGDLGGLAHAVGAVLAELLALAVDLDRHERLDVVIASAAGGHAHESSARLIAITCEACGRTRCDRSRR